MVQVVCKYFFPISEFSYFIIRFLHHIIFVINSSYFVIRFYFRVIFTFFLISKATYSYTPLSGEKSLQYKNCGKITRQRSMLLSKLVKWVPLGLQRPNIYQLFTLNLMKPCLKFAPEATFKQMYSTCSSFKQSFQVVRQRYSELQLESVLHLIFRLHTQITKFGKNVMD